MPLTALSSYATVDQFRAYIRDTTSLDTEMMFNAIAAASRDVDGYCGRHFYQHTDVQYFSPDENNLWILYLDDMDLSSSDGLTVQVEFGTDGTYPETRTFGTDFICQPINQSVGGIEGWPFTQLQAINGKIWPRRFADFVRDTVKVTGTWGWPAVPSSVVQATLVLAAENFKMMDAPFGYVGFGNFGTARVQMNPKAKALLDPYKKHTKLLMA